MAQTHSLLTRFSQNPTLLQQVTIFHKEALNNKPMHKNFAGITARDLEFFQQIPDIVL